MNLMNLIPWETMDRALAAPLATLRQSMQDVTLDETASEVLVTAQMPGFEKGDIEVDVAEQSLVVRARHKEDARAGRHGRRARARSSYSFYRSVPLPCPVRPKEAKAVFSGGLLRVELPKTKQALGRRVPIQ